MNEEEARHLISQSLSLALAHHRAGRLREAEQGYRRILSVSPDIPELLNNLASVLCDIGESQESEQYFRRAIALKPDFAEAYNNLGNQLQKSGRSKEAREALRAALALRPAYPEALNNLGIVLNESGYARDAERCFRQALSLMPNAPIVLSNLALTLANLGRLNESEKVCRSAIAAHPANSAAHNNLGLVLLRLGLLPEAEVAFRKAAELDGGNRQAAAQWVHVSQHLCIWSDAVADESRKLRQLAAEGRAGRIQPFVILSLPESTAGEQLRAAQQFAVMEFIAPLRQAPMVPAQRVGSRNKLRIAYLSADFRSHATSQLVAGVLENHDRAQFEIFGYSYGPDDASAMRARVVAAFDRFLDIRDLPHDASAAAIAADGVDILVDLKGYTSEARTQILALRPAPIQVNWLGYPGTLGHRRLADYLIGDPVVSPLEHAAHFAETLALMPHCYQPNDRSRPVNRNMTRSIARLPDNAFVFCSFNQSYKITSAVMDLWCMLLRELPDSVLWLLQPSPAACENLRKEAEARGIHRARIIFGPPMPIDEHLGRLKLADLGLDTFPVTSHTSASDLLWAGVPFVTRIGSTFASRVAASILSACGLGELVTSDGKAYVRLARGLATESGRLAILRERISTMCLTSTLFDSVVFTRDLEQLYRRMWQDHAAGRRDPICGQAR